MVTPMDPNTLLESSLFNLRANISFQKMIGSDLPLGFFSLHKIFPKTATRDPIMVWLEIVLSHAGVDNAKASPLYSFLLKEAGLGETLLDSSLQDVCYIYKYIACCWRKTCNLGTLGTSYINCSDSN